MCDTFGCCCCRRCPLLNRWLLNLDGHTAAYRLAQLLAVNSLVLKQQSPRREFYYRCMLCCVLPQPQPLHLCSTT